MKNKTDNYLERIPKIRRSIDWKINEENLVDLILENKGFMNRVFQKFFKKPKFTYIHLDNLGSFVWKLIDGEKSIVDIGRLLEEGLGDTAEPVYERLAQFFKILESNRFIEWN